MEPVHLNLYLRYCYVCRWAIAGKMGMANECPDCGKHGLWFAAGTEEELKNFVEKNNLRIEEYGNNKNNP